MKQIIKLCAVVLAVLSICLALPSCDEASYDVSLTGKGTSVRMTAVKEEINSMKAEDFIAAEGVTDYVKISVKDYGDIIVVLRDDIAPETVKNFKSLVKKGFYTGTVFHRVIENFMITANEATAKFALDNDIDIIYRVHEEPNTKKTSKAEEFFNLLGIEMVDELSAQNTNIILDLVRGSASEELVNDFLIKMQSRAVYSNKPYRDDKKEQLPYDTQPISHYALQSPHYCHFTAGIRRSTDYVCHYNILAHIHNTKPLSKDMVNGIIDRANQRQIDIDQAEKDIADVISVNWCEDHLGERFTGRISKFRLSSPEEGFDDRILVIVKNADKGFSVEIPLSQIIGNKALDCNISRQGCAIYDSKGHVILSICKPIDFIIDHVDRVGLNIIGKTDKELANAPLSREEAWKKRHFASQNGYINQKHNRVKRFETKKQHSHNESIRTEEEQPNIHNKPKMRDYE